MAKLSKKQRATERFLDVLQQRKEDFAAIEDDRASAIRRYLQRTHREARQLISAHQKEFARSGRYLTGVVPLKQAQGTAQDISSLMRREFMRVEDRLISFKEDAFKHGVWDFEVASQKLSGNLRGRISGTFSQIMPEAAYAAAEHPVMGIGPAATFNGIRTGTEQRVRSVLTQAVLSGASVQDTTAVLNEALNVSTAAAERIARTSLNAAYNDAHKSIYDANADIFSGYRWDAVMDDRTSPTCIMLHGQFWPLGATPPGPPAHWNCRSILTPVFQNPSLNAMMLEDSVRVRNYTADGKEKDGWIKSKVSAQDWLRKQPTAVTHRITGSRIKNQLFRSGKINMDDIVGADLQVRSDKQILRRAWAKRPRDRAVAKLARANGVHRAPSWDTILKEDASLARKQPYDMPASIGTAEPDPGALAITKVSPERMTKWKEDLAVTEEEMLAKQQAVKELRNNLRDIPAGFKGPYTRRLNEAKADYGRLRNKKWRISKRIKQGGGPGPEPLPLPVIDPAIARLETAWQATVDELVEVRTKLGAAKRAGRVEQIALLKKDEARLINKRWRRWKRLPPDSQVRLKTGVRPKPLKPEVRKVDPKLYQDRGKDKAFREALIEWRSGLPDEERDVLIGWQELLSNAARIRKNEVATHLSARAAKEVKLFKQALDKAPPRGGTVFRGITTDSKGLQKLLQGDDLTLQSSASSSRSEKMARRFAEARPGERVVMELKTVSSVDITDIARRRGVFEAGEEQIIRKGTKFRITGIERRGNFTYIFGEEIQARPMLRLPTLPRRLTTQQKFGTGVADVEKINKRLIALRAKAVPTLDETQELVALQSSRTTAMNKLRALRRTDKSLPALPESVRLPVLAKPKPAVVVKPRAVGTARPEQVQVKFSAETNKLKSQMDELQIQWDKGADQRRFLQREQSALYRKRLRLQQAGQTNTAEYRGLGMAQTKVGDRLIAVDNRVSALRRDLNRTRTKYNKAAAAERGTTIRQLRQPKFMTKHDSAIEYAKAELNALGYDLTTLQAESMNPTELLELLSVANGQGPGVALTPIRQMVFDNLQRELRRLGQWTTAKEKQMRLMLTSADESLLQSSQLATISFQHAPKYRASANAMWNTIKLKPREDVHTIVHEFGHHLQYRNKAAKSRMVRWQTSRTQGERSTVVYRGTKEYGKKDKFWEHYVGKIYSGGFNDPHKGFQEGVSMGLQTFVSRKGGWNSIVSKDSDHMYLIWAMLRGY